MTAELDEKMNEIKEHAQDLANAVGSFVEDLEGFSDFEALMQGLQVKHRKLFDGDLSKLTWSDRIDLFEAIRNYSGDGTALSRIEARL
jgi:hypothetical protein